MLSYSAKKKVSRYLMVIIMFILTVLIIFPFIMMLSSSVKTEAELLSPSFSLIPKHFAFDNYAKAMKAGNWGRYFYNSTFVTVVTVVLSLFFNSIAGYAFSRLKFKGRNVLFMLTLIGMMIPSQVTMVPLFVILKKIPLVGGNDILGNGGQGFLNSYWGMILPYVAGAYGVFLFRQFYMNFPSSLDDAAKIDGLGRVKAFFYIYVPLSKPIFATLAAMKANQVWSEYTWPLIITKTDNMKTVQLALTVFRSENGTNWPLLMASTALTTLPLILIFLVAQKYFVEGIAATGMK